MRTFLIVVVTAITGSLPTWAVGESGVKTFICEKVGATSTATGGHAGHGNSGGADFELALVFIDGDRGGSHSGIRRDPSPGWIEERHSERAGFPPSSRRYQVLDRAATGEWPLGTYLSRTTPGDSSVLTLYQKMTGTSPTGGGAGHRGHGSGGVGQSARMASGPMYHGTYAWVVGRSAGVMAIQCMVKE